MSNPDEPRPDADLQFDRVESATDAPAAAAGLQCSRCGKAIDASYFEVSGSVVCAQCRNELAAAHEAASATGRSLKGMSRAFIYGTGAAIAGAIIYYAVIAITDFEIGLVALLIGWMVGWAVMRGSGHRGGRRYQILAVILTYWAVGLAYAPLAYKGAMEGNTAADSSKVEGDSISPRPSDSALADTSALIVGADSLARGTSDSAVADTTALDAKQVNIGLAFLYLFVFVFLLPVLVIAGSMPSGLLSAIIIGIGLLQAWKMTARSHPAITGPYEVGQKTDLPAP